MLVFVFGMHYFMSFLVLQSSLRSRDSWLLCFYCFLNVLLLYFLTVPLVSLQVVSVVFTDHTHFLKKIKINKIPSRR